MNMLPRGVRFNKFIRAYKAGTCYSAIVINKPFVHDRGVLFKIVESLFTPSVLKNIGSLYISAEFWRRYFITCEPGTRI